jgi:hypothetical protein
MPPVEPVEPVVPAPLESDDAPDELPEVLG